MERIKVFITKLKKIFGGASKPPSENNDGVITAQPVTAPDFLVKVLLEEEKAALAGEQDFHFKKSLLTISNHFWHGGRHDGRIGQAKTQIAEIAHAHAIFIQDEIKSGYDGRLSQMKTEIKLKKVIYKSAKGNYRINDKYHKSINEKYQNHPRSFSRVAAYFYLLIAMLLTFADIPLALKLTQTGFDLDLGQNFQIQELFQSPWGVFQENWEVFILAFGIAFCTVSIKIFYDEFIEKPLAHTITQFKTLEGLDKEEIKKARWVHRLRLAVKIMVLGLTLGTIVMLGKFRFETIKYQNRIEERSAAGDPFAEIPVLTPGPIDSSASGRPAFAANEEATWQFVTEWTFILITLLFPVISGICASLGLNYLGNQRDLKISRDFRDAAQKKFLSASKDLEETKKKLSKLKGVLKWCMDENFISNVQKLLLNYYNHGYQRGLLEPDPAKLGKDLFTRAEELRNSLISRMIPQILQSANAHAALLGATSSHGNDQASEKSS